MSLAAVDNLEELHFLESLRPQYEEKGYTFVVHPNKSDLPSFLSSYQPDAIAKKHDHNVAIEVKSRSRASDQQSLRNIRRLFDGHPDWQFTVAYSGSDSQATERLPVVDKASILMRVREATQLADNGHVRAAFVVAWSLLEAGLNSASPDADKRPRKPGTVVQALAMNGYISPDTERHLRHLIQLRNRIVHGDINAEPTRADVDIVLSAIMSTVG